MKKQFTTIVCTLVAIIINFSASAQDLAFAASYPSYFASKSKASITDHLGDPPSKDPSSGPTNLENALDLSDEGLLELPVDALGSDAQVVLLDSNFLFTLPASISKWTACRQLFVRYNQLEDFPSSALEIPSLEVLDLTRNYIETLPGNIGKLASAKRLVLDLNFLKTLPTEIGQLQELEELSIRWNGLRELPAGIGQLTNLEVLTLTNNNLQTLPDEIGKLKNLKVLRINFNNFQSLPLTLAELKDTLKILDLSNNPMNEQWLSEVKAMLPNTQIIF